MTSNNPQTREWQALSSDHHLAPFSDFKQLKEKGPRIITNAKGVYLWDSEGNKILDGMAGLWCVAIGYGRDELATPPASRCANCRTTTCSSRPPTRRCWSWPRRSPTSRLKA
jgi:putrescine aminotransferase